MMKMTTSNIISTKTYQLNKHFLTLQIGDKREQSIQLEIKDHAVLAIHLPLLVQWKVLMPLKLVLSMISLYNSQQTALVDMETTDAEEDGLIMFSDMLKLILFNLNLLIHMPVEHKLADILNHQERLKQQATPWLHQRIQML